MFFVVFDHLSFSIIYAFYFSQILLKVSSMIAHTWFKVKFKYNYWHRKMQTWKYLNHRKSDSRFFRCSSVIFMNIAVNMISVYFAEPTTCFIIDEMWTYRKLKWNEIFWFLQTKCDQINWTVFHTNRHFQAPLQQMCFENIVVKV